jgi:ribonuclease VapC
MIEAGEVEFVLDSSALLALVHGEPGADVVQLVVDRSAMSTVNWAETCKRAVENNVPLEGFRDEIEALEVELVDLTADDAERSARLWSATKRAGLSLGDRACLALAARLRVPALTSDRSWAKLDVGVEVRLIR